MYSQAAAFLRWPASDETAGLLREPVRLFWRRREMNCSEKATDNHHQQIDLHVTLRCIPRSHLFGCAIAADNTDEKQNAFHTFDDTCVIKASQNSRQQALSEQESGDCRR